MQDDPEKSRKAWEERTPSNLDIIGAYAPSDHLQLFEVGNTGDEKVYVLASSRDYARIIAMMGGHIQNIANARFWEPIPSSEPGTAVHAAITGRLPGKIWIRSDHVIMRHAVYVPSERLNRRK